MQEVVSFYKKLPQGPAQAAKKPTNPLARYRAAYFDGDNASGKPLLHLAIVVLIFDTLGIPTLESPPLKCENIDFKRDLY